MAALPDFAALAAASEAQVLRLWEGLGYYSRARNLHRLARAVAPAGIPSTLEGWMELPGVGPYTAAAVSSIACGAANACVDGNVVRILARLTRDGTAHRDSALASRAMAPLAQALVDPASPGDHNQAMMELGATVCVRNSPRCPACPVRRFCAAFAAGDPGNYPRLARKATERRSVVRVWCERDGTVLLYRTPDGARSLAGLHELPTAEQAGLGAEGATRGALLSKRSRGITRFRITESIHEAPAPREPRQDLVWVEIAGLHAVALSGPHRRWTTQILAARTPAP
jgi:A/G-specific adenine glycosylase